MLNKGNIVKETTSVNDHKYACTRGDKKNTWTGTAGF